MSNRTRNCNIKPHILLYIEKVEKGEIKACLDQHKLVAHVRRCFETLTLPYTRMEMLVKRCSNDLKQNKEVPIKQQTKS